VLNNSNQVIHCKHKGNCQDRSEITLIYLHGVFTDLQHRTQQPKENTDLRSQWGKYQPLPGTLVPHTEQGCTKDGVAQFGPFQTSFSEGEGGQVTQGDLAARCLFSPASFNSGNGQERGFFTRTEIPETTSDSQPLPHITSSAEPKVEF